METITINQDSKFETTIEISYIDQWDLPDDLIEKLAEYDQSATKSYKAFYVPKTEKVLFIEENDLNFFYGANIKDLREGEILQIP